MKRNKTLVLDTSRYHMMPSLIDDMLEQLNPDKIGNCHSCGVTLFEDMYHTSDDDNLYCSDDCYFDHQDSRHDCTDHFDGGWYLMTNGKRSFCVPPHHAVDRERMCHKCYGWLNFPFDFLSYD